MFIVLSWLKMFKAIIAYSFLHRNPIVRVRTFALHLSSNDSSIHPVGIAIITEVGTHILGSANLRFWWGSLFPHFRIATYACYVGWIVLEAALWTRDCFYLFLLLFLVSFFLFLVLLVLIEPLDQKLSTFGAFDFINGILSLTLGIQTHNDLFLNMLDNDLLLNFDGIILFLLIRPDRVTHFTLSHQAEIVKLANLTSPNIFAVNSTELVHQLIICKNEN